MPELLDGTAALVVGVANKRSIAWAIARRLDAAGARIALTYQNERTEGDVRKLADTLSRCEAVLPLDVQDDGQVASAVAGAADALGGLDTLVHAVAFARPRTSGALRRHWARGLPCGARRLRLLAGGARARGRAAHARGRRRVDHDAQLHRRGPRRPGLQRHGGRQGGPGGDRPLPRLGPGRRRHPGQRDLGGARADAGRARHPGLRLDGRPGRTARPLRRDITADEVADAAVFLASPLSASVTGDTLFVDAGFHAMGF